MEVDKENNSIQVHVAEAMMAPAKARYETMKEKCDMDVQISKEIARQKVRGLWNQSHSETVRHSS